MARGSAPRREHVDHELDLLPHSPHPLLHRQEDRRRRRRPRPPPRRRPGPGPRRLRRLRPFQRHLAGRLPRDARARPPATTRRPPAPTPPPPERSPLSSAGAAAPARELHTDEFRGPDRSDLHDRHPTHPDHESRPLRIRRAAVEPAADLLAAAPLPGSVFLGTSRPDGRPHAAGSARSGTTATSISPAGPAPASRATWPRTRPARSPSAWRGSTSSSRARRPG